MIFSLNPNQVVLVPKPNQTDEGHLTTVTVTTKVTWLHPVLHVQNS